MQIEKWISIMKTKNWQEEITHSLFLHDLFNIFANLLLAGTEQYLASRKQFKLGL